MVDFIETQTLMEKCLKTLHLKDSFDERAEKLLRELGEFCELERVLVLEIENLHPANVYEWCAPACRSCAERLRELTADELCREDVFGDGTSVKIYPPIKAEGELDQALTVHIGVGGMSADQSQYLETTLKILADFMTFMLRAERSQMLLEQSNCIDALTGVLNRNAFIKDMELSSFPSVQPAGVVQISVNGIKELNDRNGRKFGDQVLVKTAQTLCGFLSFAKVYRVGGDEFIAIWKGVSGESFTAEMRKIMVWQQQEQGAKCAIGYQWAARYASLQELVNKAEERMYEDKKTYYRDAAIPTRYRQANDKVLYFANADTLSRLLAAQQFSIYFQPKFSVADHTLIGSEALVRFVTDSGQILPPDQFIPFLEDARLIDQVDFFMFGNVCAKIAEWIEQGKRVVPVSVNFSRYTIREPWFHDTLLKTWEKYHIPKKYVELEITESAEEGGDESLLDLLAKLRQDGFPVSIDDFGVKYANLSIFTNGDFSTLKVDRSLICGWENSRTREILRSLCDICQRTGVFMIVEGVELQEQLDFLKKINCKGVQGYLFSRPIPMSEYEQLYLKKETEEDDLPLTESINHNFRGFKVLYEPICDARTLQVEGAEAYLHFDPEDGQKVGTEELMTSLLSSGHIVKAGIWALEQAISACSQWVKSCPEMVVNTIIFSRQLCMEGFCDEVQQLLDKYSLAPRHLQLELTEDRFALDDETIRIALGRLQEMGVMIAVNYFGTGYSSPDKLLEDGIDVVKIDREFAKTLASNQFNRDLVNAIVCLCHQNSKRVYMQGVETVGEQRMLFLLNIDCVQGPFVSMPIDRDEFYRTFMAANCERAKIVEDNQRKQLESNNDLLVLLMDAMPFCLNLWNRNAEILACNQETLRLFGSPTYKEFKDNFFEFSPEYQPCREESVLKAKRLVTQTFEKGRLSCFWTHCLRNGEEIPTEVSFARIPYLQDYVVVSYTRDMRD